MSNKNLTTNSLDEKAAKIPNALYMLEDNLMHLKAIAEDLCKRLRPVSSSEIYDETKSKESNESGSELFGHVARLQDLVGHIREDLFEAIQRLEI